MEPTIMAGSFVLVWCWIKSYKVGDIVAFRHSTVDDLDGRPNRQPIRGSKIFIKRITSINEDKIEVSGDNKTDSLDSRQFGLIEKSNIIGKIILR